MRSILAAAILAASLSPATAATPCDDIWQKPLADGQVLLKKAAPQIKGLPSKPKVFEVMQHLAHVVVKAPVNVGDIIVTDVLGTGSNIVATKKILLKA